jgi:catabolite regulation protein CreA
MVGISICTVNRRFRCSEKEMIRLAALLACCALITPAHADSLVDGSQHELPTHKAWMQVHDTLDVIDDPQHGVVCYVARQSDSHSLQMLCLKVSQ